MKKEDFFKKKAFATRAIHVGQPSDPMTGAVIPPITLSSTFAQSSPGRHKGYEYSRAKNPTRHALEEALASLEGGEYCFACSSGVAASSLCFEFLEADSLLVAEKDLYGGTLRILHKILKRRGIKLLLLDLSDKKNIQKIPPSCKMVWLETPTNPELKIIDLESIGKICKKHNILMAVDNTFLSPFFQNPLKWGADIVVHSATKYLSGHSDLLSGAIITKRKDLADKLAFWSMSLGPVLSPWDSYLLLRSLKTLSIRMLKHEQNAITLAQYLKTHKAIRKVIYPGLTSHPQHKIALKQMTGFGGMLSFHLNSSRKDVLNFLRHFKIFTLAESLGGVESLIEHPASMTHASSPHPPDDSLVRVSVGLEDVKDLKQDLSQALGNL